MIYKTETVAAPSPFSVGTRAKRQTRTAEEDDLFFFCPVGTSVDFNVVAEAIDFYCIVFNAFNSVLPGQGCF